MFVVGLECSMKSFLENLLSSALLPTDWSPTNINLYLRFFLDYPLGILSLLISSVFPELFFYFNYLLSLRLKFHEYFNASSLLAFVTDNLLVYLLCILVTSSIIISLFFLNLWLFVISFEKVNAWAAYSSL